MIAFHLRAINLPEDDPRSDDPETIWNNPRNKSSTSSYSPEMELSSLPRFLWPLHYIAAPVVHACRLSCIIPPHFRHRTRVPVAGVDVECSPRHPGSRLQHGLAGSRPKMCQVHVALLGSRAPCNETAHSMPSKRASPCVSLPSSHKHVSSLPRR